MSKCWLRLPNNQYVLEFYYINSYDWKELNENQTHRIEFKCTHYGHCNRALRCQETDHITLYIQTRDLFLQHGLKESAVLLPSVHRRLITSCRVQRQSSITGNSKPEDTRGLRYKVAPPWVTSIYMQILRQEGGGTHVVVSPTVFRDSLKPGHS